MPRHSRTRPSPSQSSCSLLAAAVAASNDKRQLNLPCCKLRLAFRGDPDQAQPTVFSLHSVASCSREQPSISFSCHQAYLFSCVCRRLPSINVNSFLSKLSMATCCVLRCVWQRRRRSREGGARWGTHQVK